MNCHLFKQYSNVTSNQGSFLVSYKPFFRHGNCQFRHKIRIPGVFVRIFFFFSLLVGECTHQGRQIWPSRKVAVRGWKNKCQHTSLACEPIGREIPRRAGVSKLASGVWQRQAKWCIMVTTVLIHLVTLFIPVIICRPICLSFSCV